MAVPDEIGQRPQLVLLRLAEHEARRVPGDAGQRHQMLRPDPDGRAAREARDQADANDGRPIRLVRGVRESGPRAASSDVAGYMAHGFFS
jgi:hypothetical protein